MGRLTVSSRQNPLVKSVCGLTDKKNRVREGLFRFDGVKLLGEILDTDANVRYVIYSESCDVRVRETIEDALARERLGERQVVEVTEPVFQKISEESAPEGVITVAEFLDGIHIRSEQLPLGKILIAESLRDPGNLGTVIRSCYALGIDTLVLTDDCADVYNSKTIRAAMGAAFRLNTQTVARQRIPEFILNLKDSGRRVYAAALDSRSVDIRGVTLGEGDCFVIGNEGHGLCEDTVRACTGSVIIPMREGAESLNAAAAAAICIWETVRA